MTLDPLKISDLPVSPSGSDTLKAIPMEEHFDALAIAGQYTGVVSGCQVTDDPVTPDMTVDVAVGNVRLAGKPISVSAQADNSITAASGSYDRIDLVSVNSSGTVVITTGTAEANPVCPDLPADSVPLAEVIVRQSVSAINQTDIQSLSTPVPDNYTIHNVKWYGAVGDGATDDSTEIQAAIDAAELEDGIVYFPPAVYAVASELDVTTVCHIELIGPGATLKATGTSMNILRVRQDNTLDSRCLIRGLIIDGDSQTGVTGLKVVDTNSCKLENVEIYSCPSVGWLLTTETAGRWCEMNGGDNVNVNGCGTGIQILKNGGENSLDLTKMRNVTVNQSDLGFSIGQSVTVKRGYFDINVWTPANSTAYFLDGDIGGATYRFAMECDTATGTVGIDIGDNMWRGEFDYDMHLSIVGPFGTEVQEGSGETLSWQQGPIFRSRQNFVPVLGVQDHDTDTVAWQMFADGVMQWNDTATPTLNICRLIVGSGTPEGAVSAPVGSVFLRTDGGAGTIQYLKASGTGNTGWVALAAGTSVIGDSASTERIEFSGGNVSVYDGSNVKQLDVLDGGAVIANQPTRYTTTQTLTAADRIVNGDGTAFTITLPALSGLDLPHSLMIFAGGAGNITVAPNGADNIDGSGSSKVLTGGQSPPSAIALVAYNTTDDWETMSTQGSVS